MMMNLMKLKIRWLMNLMKLKIRWLMNLMKLKIWWLMNLMKLKITRGLDGVLDLNSSPAHDEPDVPQDVVAGQPDGAQDMVADQPGEQSLHVKHPKKDLTNEENYAAYFALEVIKSRDGDFQTEDKELVASLLNTSVRTIERIWRKAQDQLEQGHPVDVSNKKKGNSGQKKERFGTLEDENNITKQKKDNSISSKSSRC
jgi:hypothetical protein